MVDEPAVETGAPSVPGAQPGTPGARLRAAREAKGLSVQDIAARTRIAQRQLEAVERDDYAALPGIPYAVGFARAYARVVDLDEVAIAAEVRDAVHNSDIGANRYEAFEPADPARVPSRALAWTAAGIAIVVVAGFAVWRTQLLTPPTSDEIAQEQAPAQRAGPASATPAAPAVQPVVFTAVDDVWMRVYDDTGQRLKDGLMKKGERYTLPPAARNPMILTGRPQALSVTVGGKPVPPLGDADRTIADVPVSAGALLARTAPVPTLSVRTPPAAASRPRAVRRPTPQRPPPEPAQEQPAAVPAPATVPAN